VGHSAHDHRFGHLSIVQDRPGLAETMIKADLHKNAAPYVSARLSGDYRNILLCVNKKNQYIGGQCCMAAFIGRVTDGIGKEKPFQKEGEKNRRANEFRLHPDPLYGIG